MLHHCCTRYPKIPHEQRDSAQIVVLNVVGSSPTLHPNENKRKSFAGKGFPLFPFWHGSTTSRPWRPEVSGKSACNRGHLPSACMAASIANRLHGGRAVYGRGYVWRYHHVLHVFVELWRRAIHAHYFFRRVWPVRFLSVLLAVSPTFALFGCHVAFVRNAVVFVLVHI